MADGSSLCARCGLCCDGTLYGNAKAEAHELPRMAAAGLATLPESGEGYSFQLPCPRLSGSCCTIYEDRFTICRSFRCKLLSNLLSDETSLEQAQAKVDEAKRLLASVVERGLPAAAAPRREAARKAARWAEEQEPATRSAAAVSYVEVVTLESYLNRHFRKVPDGGTLLG